MRQTISGLVAAFAVMVAGAAPAMACGGGLFQGSCSPCGQAYVEPCAQPQVYQPPVYVPPAPVYSGCNTCGRGWGYERLVEPETQYYAALMRHQYYYVNQGPTYTGPGDFAPRPTYYEGAYGPRVYGHRAHPYYRHHGYGYSTHPGYRYGYAHHSMH
ncbi:hypothetical protein [Bradyrhizobium erythrophlei]|jgi:hypothetical protein|uniref:Uncharacterized protein n=1 Tax=Bradyrhizobium erythrophlei TaxID=1437360 RepID=A0A1M5TRQ4_9BRAD|nr:hypothetical protein [Bradyrhizobium erythrophlei]SHH53340.1 hypothetical protein SAMN05444169_7938 [Bradyrhizobium erythrophlei]